jgi:hypothetical protein
MNFIVSKYFEILLIYETYYFWYKLNLIIQLYQKHFAYVLTAKKKKKTRKTLLNRLNWNCSIEFSTRQLKIFTRHGLADERIFQALGSGVVFTSICVWRSQWPGGLRCGSWPHEHWDCGFESHYSRGRMSAVSCVGRDFETGWSPIRSSKPEAATGPSQYEALRGTVINICFRLLVFIILLKWQAPCCLQGTETAGNKIRQPHIRKVPDSNPGRRGQVIVTMFSLFSKGTPSWLTLEEVRDTSCRIFSGSSATVLPYFIRHRTTPAVDAA